MAQTSQLLRQLAARDARKYGVDPAIFLRQIQQESGFNPGARSSAGAVGIAQFMPGTAASYHIDPRDPVQSLDAAARFDASELKAFGGDYRKALAAYNAGAGNADKWSDPSFAGGQTYRYVRSILGGSGTPDVSPPAHVTPGSQVAAQLAEPSAAPPAQDFRSVLAQALSGASGTGDYTGFYQTLTKALQARNQPQTPATQGFAPRPLPARTGQTFTATPLPDTGQIKLAAVPLTLATRDGIQVNATVLPTVEQIAARFGVKANSGYRNAQHNAQVGGAPNSDHLSGNAVDFTGSGQQMRALYQWAQGRFPYVEPWGQAGGNHVHISLVRGGK